MQVDHRKFFISYRNTFGKIRKTQTALNIDQMLNNLTKYSHMYDANAYVEQMAYIAATIHHETGGRYSAFKEVRQGRTDTKYRRMIRRLQDRYWYSGYYGRGPVQLTWKRNYKWASEITGVDLVKNPDLLLTDLGLGFEVTIKGMMTGAFTGKSLPRYVNYQKVDYTNARRVVNGKDRAALIASYAYKFEKIFRESVNK